MALRVWLPLIGNLHNQGTSNHKIALTDGNTWTSPGKIGNNALTLTKLQLIVPSTSCMSGAKEISYAYWIKVNTAWSADWLDGIRWIETDGSATSTARQEFYTNCTLIGTWYKGGAINGKTFTPGVWTHLAGTFNYNTGEAKFYINGVLSGSTTNVNTTYYCRGDFCIGDNGVNICENDVRIYDHCLSAAEVKEISQGLVLHYKLDDTYMETSTFLTSTINTSAYNSQNGKYGYNADSNLARTEGFFQGKNCIKISTITAGQNAQPYSYFSNLYTSNGTNSPAYKALSFDYFTTCPTTTWLNIYKLGSGTGTATWKTVSATAGTRTGTYTNSSNSILVQPNEWNRVEVIFNGTTDADAQWGYCINGPKHTSSADYYFLFANIQLEQNDHVTGQGSGLHKAIITDSSGYGHNGTIVGNLILNAETKRYSASTKWNSSDPTASNETGICYIQTPITLTTPLQMSITWWAKPESGYGGGTGQAALCTSNNTSRPTDYNTTAFHHRDSGFDIYPSDASGGKRLSFTYTKNEWHHYALTYDGTVARSYQDGVEKTNVTVGTNKTLATFSQLYIGYSQAGGVKRKTLGSYSDFRIYCTALSADDIKQLYQVGAKVDNLGGLHTFEAVENIPNIIFKIDSARGAKIFQDGLGSYTQTNCQVTLTNNGYRIYRPPNLTTSANGNTMWGGLKLVNQTSDTVSVYTTPRDNCWNLQQNHTYLCAFHAKGQSSNGTTFSWTNNMGWGGGGVSPSPTIIINDGIPNDFQGEKECIFIFTIGDTLSKTCTTAYASYVAGTTYLSYRHLTFGWGYTSTGSLGTDLYLTNLRLYDITNFIGKIKKTGQANFSDFVENNSIARILKNSEFLINNLIER